MLARVIYVMLLLASCRSRGSEHRRAVPACAVQDCATGKIVDDGCSQDGRCMSCVNACEPTPVAPPATAPAAPSVAPVDAEMPSAPAVGLVVEGDGGIDDWRFDAQGLPAISADGRRFVFHQGVQADSVAVPTLSLVIRRVDDASGPHVLDVLTVAEASRAHAAPNKLSELRATVDGRIRRANALLSKEHWLPLTRVMATDGTPESTSRTVSTANLSITLAPPRAMVRSTDGKVVVERTFPKWAPQTVTTPYASCPYHPTLNAALVDEERRVVVIEVNGVIEGGDLCTGPAEPIPRYEAVRY